MAERGLQEQIDELKRQFEKSEPGSVEQQRIVECLDSLYRIGMDEEKNNAAYEEMSVRMDSIEKENELKTEQAKKNNFFRIAEIGVGFGTFVLQLLNNKSVLGTILKFEKTDSFTSDGSRNVSRNLINDMFRSKKK